MLLGDEGDETRPRGCKYTLHQRARMLKYYLSSNRERFAQYKLHPRTPRVPPRVLASGTKPCGGNSTWQTNHLARGFPVRKCRVRQELRQCTEIDHEQAWSLL